MVSDTESREAIRDDMVFPAGGEFYMNVCPRCAGLLVNEWCNDFWNAGEQKARVLRCVQCGCRIDAVILQNQRRPTVKSVHIGDTRHMYPVSTAMSGEVA